MVSKVKDKLKETLDATPKAIRWMLLAAAFIVVLILLFLLINKPKTVANPGIHADKEIKLTITPVSADFSNTQVGGKKDQTFKISATDDAIIDDVVIKNSVTGFNIKQNNCRNWNVNKDIACKVNVTFAPANADVSGDVVLEVNWHDNGDSREVNPKTETITIPVSAVGVAIKPKPAPEPEPELEPEPEPEPELEPEDEPDDNADSDFDLDSEPEPIIGGNENIFKQPEPEKKPVETPKRKAPEKCSDFAMPGYSPSGVHIGWIKPKNGRYEFHPFSDTDCNKPTGIYNPDTGIITSIDGKGTKIGTDADHRGATVDLNSLPKLKSKPGNVATRSSSSYQPSGMGNLRGTWTETGGGIHLIPNKVNEAALNGTATSSESVYSSMPYDRTFILRQFKPIPATIVSEVRADPSVYNCDSSGNCKGSGIPVRATVDRNVYSDNGRTVIIPTGTLLMGYLTGELPGPYKSIGRMKINWYQFIRPDGVEFNFGSKGQDPYSADSQGRVGVPGYGSTDYVEQMVMPLLTAIIPAAVNMIAPIADTFVNQIDLDNNTVVQSGTVRSSELAKNEVISAWNRVAQKLMVDALDNTVPPFSIAAGTRITVYSPVDLIATCGTQEDNPGKKCAIHEFGSKERREWKSVQEDSELTVNYDDASWTGQVRSFALDGYCSEPDEKTGIRGVDKSKIGDLQQAGYDYRTVLAYCQSLAYQAKNQAKYETYYQNKLDNGIQGVDKDGKAIKLEKGSTEYNQQILGLQYAKDADGNDTDIIKNPFEKTSSGAGSEPVGSLDCDGQAPDQYGCCPGETYTELPEQGGFFCCPDGGGDCFPPLELD